MLGIKMVNTEPKRDFESCYWGDRSVLPGGSQSFLNIYSYGTVLFGVQEGH